MTSSFLKPLAGLCAYDEAALPGLTVDEGVDRLRRYVYLKSQSLFLMASRFNGIPEWEVKGALSLHLWQDAEHSSFFRKRITEMRTPPHHLDKVPERALEQFIEEIKRSKDSLEFLAAIYEVLKPACLAAFHDHLSKAHPVADQPTRRLLRFAINEEEEQIAWGQDALRALLGQNPDAQATVEEWKRHLRDFLAAAGGIDGVQPRPELAGLVPRTPELPDTERVPVRDERFPSVWRSRGVVPDAGASVHERIWWMMNVRLNEMHVSELIATVIADWKGQPWEFYHDLSRHLWDETRHCMLGEIAFASQGIDFTKIPTHTGFAEYPNTQLTPAERYAFLWGIEQSLMTKSGKQAEVALARAGNDERATVFQDFDWADEVLHAQIGRRWLEPYYGDRTKMSEAYERIRPAYDQMKEEDLRLAGRDWWPAFYEAHLRQKDPNLGRSLEAAPPADDGY